MIKMIRKVIGGTWLKIKSCDNSSEYWVHPTDPEAMEQLTQKHVIKKECYGKCLLGLQRVQPA